MAAIPSRSGGMMFASTASGPGRCAWSGPSVQTGPSKGGGTDLPLASAFRNALACKTRRPWLSQDHQAKARAYEQKSHEAQIECAVDSVGLCVMMVGHSVNLPTASAHKLLVKAPVPNSRAENRRVAVLQRRPRMPGQRL